MLHLREQALDYRDVSTFFHFNNSRAFRVTSQAQRNTLFSLKIPILQIREETNSLSASTENERCPILLFVFPNHHLDFILFHDFSCASSAYSSP